MVLAKVLTPTVAVVRVMHCEQVINRRNTPYFSPGDPYAGPIFGRCMVLKGVRVPLPLAQLPPTNRPSNAFVCSALVLGTQKGRGAQEPVTRRSVLRGRRRRRGFSSKLLRGTPNSLARGRGQFSNLSLDRRDSRA